MRRVIGYLISVAVLLVVAATPFRVKLEAVMPLHMLVQFPLVVYCGFQLASAMPVRFREIGWSLNRGGISGLLAVSIILMFWMIPRALDMVLENSQLELMKFVTLFLSGVFLRLSWRTAQFVVQGFFLANVLPMMAVVGWLYIESPVRICNAYLSSDQYQTGVGLISLATLGCLWWLIGFFMQEVKLNASGKQA